MTPGNVPCIPAPGRPDSSVTTGVAHGQNNVIQHTDSLGGAPTHPTRIDKACRNTSRGSHRALIRCRRG